MKLLNVLSLGVINVLLCTTVFGGSEVAETFSTQQKRTISQYLIIRDALKDELQRSSPKKFGDTTKVLTAKFLEYKKELESFNSAEVSNLVFLDEIVINQLLKNKKQ